MEKLLCKEYHPAQDGPAFSWIAKQIVHAKIWDKWRDAVDSRIHLVQVLCTQVQFMSIIALSGIEKSIF